MLFDFMIEIKMLKDQNLKGYTLIEAFPGIGLVGTMAGSYIIDKLPMEYIGHITSDMFPPIASIHNSVPMYPARIYKNDKYKLLMFIAEFAVPVNLVYQLSSEILAFSRKYGISKIVSVGGMPSDKPTNTIYITSSDPDLAKKATKLGIKPIDEGVVAGVSAYLLVNSNELKISSMDVLVEVNPTVTDPRYAEIAITGLNKLLGINVDLAELKKETEIVENKIREMLSKVKASHEHYANTAAGNGPSMYA
jgi:uncharacterized protein